MKSFDGAKEWHESFYAMHGACGSELTICINDAMSLMMRNSVLRNVQNEVGRVMNSIKLQDYEMKYGYQNSTNRSSS
jgi:hypothetical protein